MPTITSFLVGLGFDYDAKGEKNIASGIDSLKSKALQLGAVVAGAFGIKALTTDFATATDGLGKFSKSFGLVTDDVNSLGRALEFEGGGLSSALSALEGIERFRAQLQTGDIGFLAKANLTGIDTNAIINASDAMEAFLLISEDVSKLNRQQQLNAQQALGVDLPTIRLLAQGRQPIEDRLSTESERRPVTQFDTMEAARFNDEITELTGNIGGFADVFSRELLPRMSDLLSGLNEFIGPDAREGFFIAVGDTLDSASTILDSPATPNLSTRSSIRSQRESGGRPTNAPSFTEFFDATFGDFELLPDAPSTLTRGQRKAQERRSNGEGSHVQKVSLDVRVTSDSDMFKAKVTEINEQSNQQALDDLSTSTGG